jgi:hypothetical protein
VSDMLGVGPASALAPVPLGLGSPGVPISLGLSQPGPVRFDLGMQLPGIHGQLDALVLDLGELLPKLRVLDNEREEFGGSLACARHAVPYSAHVGAWVYVSLRDGAITVVLV